MTPPPSSAPRRTSPLRLLCAAAAAAACTAQVPAGVGNHGMSSGDASWSVVQVDPAAFGQFISPLGTGALTLAVDGGAPAPLAALPGVARDAVVPALALSLDLASLGAPGVALELDEFAPLSPFFALQGFIPALLASARFSAANATAVHSFELAYAFTCNGLPGACIGESPPPPPAQQASEAAPPPPAPRFPGAPAVVNVSVEVFVGAAGGDAASATCGGGGSNGGAIAHPPPLNFTLVAENSAAGGAACPFEGWGPGDSLRDCELACAEDANCTTINFNAHSGDCVFRICADPAHPFISGPAQGYDVYTTTSPKGPYPELCSSVSLALRPGEEKRALLVLGHHDANGKYAAAWPTPQALFAYLVDSADDLLAQHSAFIGALPATGSASTDESVRWFLAPPVLLTKGVLGADGTSFTSTMGYVEMCARDGYWTTWLHAYMWPALEKDMIREFTMFQCNSSVPECLGNSSGLNNDGKIPTTVLPLIYRDDNIDVTGYFVLRVARYVRASGDVELLAEVYPSVRRALLFLQRRDIGDGVPAALEHSQWADWLDVDYMIGRKYAPHFVFVYLAAMREGAAMATRLGFAADAAAFATSLAAGLRYVNAPITVGVNGTGEGMWNSSGGYFQDVWFDGRTTNYTLTDNVVGSFFGLVDDNRTLSVFAHSSASGNEAPWGMRDYFPYLPGADDPQGVYGKQVQTLPPPSFRVEPPPDTP